MNWKEIFSWYWEQKGVENPERFLNEGEAYENQLAQIQNDLMEQIQQNPELANQLTEILNENETPDTNDLENEIPLKDVENGETY